MTTTDRRDATDAPAPSAAEQARLDRIENAPACDESAVERVARAIWESMPGTVPWNELSPRTPTRDEYRRYARAAIDALKPAPGTEAAGPTVQRDHSPGHCVSVEDANRVLAETRGSTEDALHRVLDLADQWESDAARADDAEPATRDDLSRMISASRWGRQHAAEVRDAIAGPQREQPVADWERELIHARCGASGCDCR